MKILSSFLNTGRTRLLALCLLPFLAAPLSAQRMTLTERRAAPVVVESATIRAEITGRIAVTTFDLVFRNPNERPLEGMFEFPLLDGQQVTGFGLDIDGKLRAAVPVEKDKGRIVFEQIERRRVDPGLLEKTEGNNYRARVFPIPARGTRRVMITYQEDLGGGGEANYRLPLDFATPLRDFDLLVEMPAGAEKVQSSTTLPLQLPAWEDARALHVQRSDFAARGVVELHLPALDGPATITQRRQETEYFYAELPVGRLKPAARPAPAVMGLLWDASASGAERDHEREFKLLEAWFAAVPDVEVRLVALRDQAAAPQTFRVKGGDWSALQRELKNLTYDGATSFDGLADDAAVGEWLLFSDGLFNYGASRGLASLPLRAPVHALLAAPRANPAFLRGLAQRHGGEFVNLLSTAARPAVLLLRHESVRVLAVTAEAGEVSQVFPEAGAPVRDGRVAVTGILQAPSAALRLRIGTASEARDFTLNLRSGENPGELAARAWAAAKIASLEPEFTANREDIRQTSRDFGIVTADTSLIVLETLQDYLLYDIAPPAELRKEWDSQRQERRSARVKGLDARREYLAQLFAERVRWWEQKFPMADGRTWSIDRNFGRAGNSGGNTSWTVTANVPPSPADDRMVDDVLVLSPFVVATESDSGYTSRSTLAGTRLRTGASSSSSFAGSKVGAEDDEEEEPLSEPTAHRLKAWNGKTGLIDRLRRTAPEKRYAVYRDEQVRHQREPGFFLAMADYFLAAGDRETGLRVLSNLAEMGLEHPPLLRVLAHRLMEAGRPDLAGPLFAQVLALRPEEPQSRRDLALACAALQQTQRAVDLLWSIVTDAESSRFAEIELTAIGEMNALIARATGPLNLAGIDPRFLNQLPTGLRVVLSWDSDACDIDLWVDDPNGERVMYDHACSLQGGRISRDFTQGYGPEEFLLRDPKPGKYAVRINYYGENSVTALGPVTAQVRIITGFGTAAEKEQRYTVTLTKDDQQQLVATVDIPAGPGAGD